NLALRLSQQAIELQLGCLARVLEAEPDLIAVQTGRLEVRLDGRANAPAGLLELPRYGRFMFARQPADVAQRAALPVVETQPQPIARRKRVDGGVQRLLGERHQTRALRIG